MYRKRIGLFVSKLSASPGLEVERRVFLSSATTRLYINILFFSLLLSLFLCLSLSPYSHLVLFRTPNNNCVCFVCGWECQCKPLQFGCFVSIHLLSSYLLTLQAPLKVLTRIRRQRKVRRVSHFIKTVAEIIEDPHKPESFHISFELLKERKKIKENETKRLEKKISHHFRVHPEEEDRDFESGKSFPISTFPISRLEREISCLIVSVWTRKKKKRLAKS